MLPGVTFTEDINQLYSTKWSVQIGKTFLDEVITTASIRLKCILMNAMSHIDVTVWNGAIKENIHLIFTWPIFST